MKFKQIIAIICILLFPFTTHAAEYDLSIPPQGLHLAATNILVGDVVKIYATINNIGSSDIEGTAVCKDNGNLIGMKSLSAKYSGASEEVWFTWVPMQPGNHTVSLDVITDSVEDENPGDNQTSVTVFVDGDNDNDGIGDSVDPDDDNDGIYDWDEAAQGSNPLLYDTDHDGVGDKQDEYPTDPTRSSTPSPTPEIQQPKPTGQVLGAEDNNVQVASVNTSETQNNNNPDPRVLGEEDSVTNTDPIIHENPIVALQTDENYNKKVLPEVEVNNKANWLSWPYILWIIAGTFAVLAGLFFLFFLLARKRKKEDNKNPKESKK